MKLYRLFPLTLVVIALLLASALATSYPLTVQDELGQQVILTHEPMRVISMLPSDTETLCAIDACDKLVGVGDYSNYPVQVKTLPKLGGGLKGPDIEKIVALQPDLVLVSEYGELAKKLRGAGLTVYAGSPQTVDDTFTFFKRLGLLVNRQAQAETLVENVQNEMKAISQKVAGLPKSRVYYEVDPTPYSAGPNSFIGTLISDAGGENIVKASMGDFPRLEPEYIIAADPQVIFFPKQFEDEKDLKARPGWSSISAFKNGKVIGITSQENDFISRPGPRMAEALRFFARTLHPKAFAGAGD